jgi:Pyridine nucleotide-disulphide oxidoreductase
MFLVGCPADAADRPGQLEFPLASGPAPGRAAAARAIDRHYGRLPCHDKISDLPAAQAVQKCQDPAVIDDGSVEAIPLAAYINADPPNHNSQHAPTQHPRPGLCSRSSRPRIANAAAGMSAYLLDRLNAHPGVTVRVSAKVTGLSGTTALDAITITDSASSSSAEQPCRGLFCFIGADPATAWLNGVTLDHDGYISTDVQLDPVQLGPTWTALDRAPLPFEASMPAVFAAGDVRHGSMKRVASAVGEGASAIRSVHQAIGMRF